MGVKRWSSGKDEVVDEGLKINWLGLTSLILLYPTGEKKYFTQTYLTLYCCPRVNNDDLKKLWEDIYLVCNNLSKYINDLLNFEM